MKCERADEPGLRGWVSASRGSALNQQSLKNVVKRCVRRLGWGGGDTERRVEQESATCAKGRGAGELRQLRVEQRALAGLLCGVGCDAGFDRAACIVHRVRHRLLHIAAGRERSGRRLRDSACCQCHAHLQERKDGKQKDCAEAFVFHGISAGPPLRTVVRHARGVKVSDPRLKFSRARNANASPGARWRAEHLSIAAGATARFRR